MDIKSLVTGVTPLETIMSMGGLPFLQAMIAGKLPQPPICATLGFYLAEAADHLSGLESGLLELEGGASTAFLLDTVFRAAHSLKGASGMFGLTGIVGLTHEVEGLLAAMRDVPRHLFVPPSLRARAYEPYPLPIGEGQTISQPYIVAFMLEALTLRGGEKVLEIGTGSGYQAAVLAKLARRVYSIERFKPLSKEAERLLINLGIYNVV